MFRKTSLLALAGCMFVSGCCCMDREERRDTATGGLIGAGAGILIGSMTGSWLWGGLVGGGLGALTGYVVAENAKDHREQHAATKAEGVATDASLRDQADREFKTAMDARDTASAEYHLKRSIDLYPTPAAHNNLGLIQLQSGDRTSARASFRRAIVLDPSYDPALRNLEKLGA
jgi:tetratricopeptide (TPR) repeat protein